VSNRWTGASHDAAGNQRTLPARTFSYDAENRLKESTQPNTGHIHYSYDGDA
jgi:hypothetical protein